MKSAENIFASLGTGYKNGIKRPSNPTEDRFLRQLIETANFNGDLIIPTGDRGYYRVDLENEEEVCKAREYLTQELARVSTMQLKISIMHNTLYHLPSTAD